MVPRLGIFFASAVVAVFAIAPAHALTMKECSAKYQAAKDNGTLGGATWNEFRKAQCGADNSGSTTNVTPAKTGAVADSKPGSGLTMKECSAKYQAAKDAGKLGGLSWNDFRKSQCAAGAKPEPVGKTSQDEKKKPAVKVETAGAGLSMHDCSVKYQAAKAAHKLGNLKWNDFRKAQCGTSAADDETVPSPDEAQYNGEPESPAAQAPGSVKFPKAIAAKYASESPGKGRLHTCLDQYYADKDSNSLGGLKWIQKGGGFYSLCNAKLKG